MECRKISHLWGDFPSELNLSSGNFQPFQAGFQDAIHFGSGFWLTDSDLMTYPLVNCHITMENHHFLWENPLFLWSFSIAMLNYQRVLSDYWQSLQTDGWWVLFMRPWDLKNRAWWPGWCPPKKNSSTTASQGFCCCKKRLDPTISPEV